MEWEFSITIPADIAAIPGVSAALETAMNVYAFTDQDILDTQLSVEEAITNTIVHGYHGSPGEIAVTCTASHGIVEVRIEDSAPPFDPLSLPDPDISANLDDRMIGGLGIHLIRRLMDDILYRYEDGKNILVLVKRKSE